MRIKAIAPAGLLVLALMLAAFPAQAAVGSPFGARVQNVVQGVKENDTVTVDCTFDCRLTWESMGHSRITYRCGDGYEASAVFPQLLVVPSQHTCCAKITLEAYQATEAVAVWRGGGTCGIPLLP